MKPRPYYSVRTGKHPTGGKLDLSLAKRLFLSTYNELIQREYFQESLGYRCVDRGIVIGTLGSDIEAKIFLSIRKENLWPIEKRIKAYSEDDLFDMIEFLYDCVSMPVHGHYHSYADCGWHYETFDNKTGRKEYRQTVNEILADYGEGYELSESGEILISVDEEFQSLLDAEVPGTNGDNGRSRLSRAAAKFRSHRSTLSDRRDAIRELADVLEFLRPKIKEVLFSKDEADLFNIANNFGIRHHNQWQKEDYDKAIWYSWMFYYYLASIHACIRLIEKQGQQ